MAQLEVTPSDLRMEQSPPGNVVSTNNAAERIFPVTLYFEADNLRHELKVRSDMTILQIKQETAAELQLDVETLQFPDLEEDCRKMKSRFDIFTLDQAGLSPENCENITIRASFNRSEPSKHVYVMPNSIKVVVDIDGEESPRSFDVQVTKFTGSKPYLGGFRNKKTEAVYHHASSQTILSTRRTKSGPERFHRETQTAEILTRSQQTQRECGTQMQRSDLQIDDSCDRTVIAKPYFDSSQNLYLKTSSVLAIQCFWRGYIARCLAHRIRLQKSNRLQKSEEDESKLREAAELRQKKEIERRMHPRTFDDFEILYNELDSWRQFEAKRIRESNMTKDEEKLATKAALEKETKLLQMIDRLKQTANKENRKQRISKMLEMMAKPKKWQMSDGDIKEVHTPHTIRAKELRDLYKGTTLPLVSTDERLDVLLHVKWTVKEFHCPLTKEIIELIDREADMLHRGRSVKSLEGLRQRISNLFLQFIETPEFNPEAAHFNKEVNQRR